MAAVVLVGPYGDTRSVSTYAELVHYLTRRGYAPQSGSVSAAYAAVTGTDPSVPPTAPSEAAAVADPSTPLGAALKAAYVPKWAASTPYTAGTVVLAPDGTLVAAKADFVSAPSYTASNWTPVGFVPLAADSFATGRIYEGPALPNDSPLVQKIVKDDTYPSATNLPLSYKEWQHNGSQGYILHLTCGPAMTAGSPALIGLGVDNDGRGLFVNNKKTGVGAVFTQNDTITSATAYALLLNQSSTVAPGFYLAQGIAGAKPALVVTANVAAAASQRLAEFRRTVTTPSDTLVGYVAADTGNLVWQTQASFQPKDAASIPLLVVGLTGQTADLVNYNVTGSGTVAKVEKDGTVTSVVRHRIQGPGGQFDLYDTGGTVNARRFNILQAGSALVFRAKDDNNATAGAGDLLQLAHATGNATLKDGAVLATGAQTTGLKIGAGATQKLGFYGAPPVAQQARPADLAGVIAALAALGLTA